MNAIDELEPDLVVLAGFMRILTPEFVRHYSGRLINIHPSLLPLYPGLNTHQRAIDAGDSVHGVSVHFVTEELDGGPVIAQAAVPITAEDDANSLKDKVHTQEHVLYPIVVKWFTEGRLRLGKQGPTLDGQQLPANGLRLNAV
jgi:phosphoribosylglycinamide formyltransferase 1